MRTHALALVLLGLGTASGCANQAFSPTAGFLPTEEPRPLPEGRRTLGGGVGLGDIGLDAAELVGGQVRYREGLSDMLELQAEGAVAVITEASRADTFPAIISARVGLKGRLVPGFDHVGWTAGLGVGGSAGGLFAASDLGLQVGWVNRYVTPWFQVSGVVSVPVTSEDVDLARPEDDAPNVDHPVTTFGVRLAVGITTHIGDSDAELHLALGNLRLWDVHGEDESVVALTVGFDVPF
jgi:hypothetical protein